MSSSNNSSASSGGINILGLLGVAFVILKLLGKIDWSWWWVTLPFWGVIALIIIGLGVYFLIAVIVSFFK